MKERIIDSEVTLVPYYPNYEVAFEWYQDKDLCKQVDNIDFTYSMDRLKAMYSYLSTHGECYYIRYNGVLVGDVTLRNDGEISIVVCREYQNRHIGRRCVLEMIKLAEEKSFSQVKANIYSFNEQSRKMFLSVGFKQTEEEWFVREL
ncbi:MAG: GNAT family N-acetyltransferase [Ruminiclostridium sp.]